MSIEAISSMVPNAPVEPADAAFLPVSAPQVSGFSDMVTQGLDAVDAQLSGNETTLRAMAAGEPTNLHQVMVQMEESRISFQLLMQVRSRVLDAYSDIMKMQI